MKKTIILSLGGSIIVPDKIDSAFLKKFKRLILKHLPKYNFVIFCGGGKIARNYQAAGKFVPQNWGVGDSRTVNVISGRPHKPRRGPGLGVKGRAQIDLPRNLVLTDHRRNVQENRGIPIA